MTKRRQRNLALCDVPCRCRGPGAVLPGPRRRPLRAHTNLRLQFQVQVQLQGPGRRGRRLSSAVINCRHAHHWPADDEDECHHRTHTGGASPVHAIPTAETNQRTQAERPAGPPPPGPRGRHTGTAPHGHRPIVFGGTDRCTSHGKSVSVHRAAPARSPIPARHRNVCPSPSGRQRQHHHRRTPPSPRRPPQPLPAAATASR